MVRKQTRVQKRNRRQKTKRNNRRQNKSLRRKRQSRRKLGGADTTGKLPVISTYKYEKEVLKKLNNDVEVDNAIDAFPRSIYDVLGDPHEGGYQYVFAMKHAIVFGDDMNEYMKTKKTGYGVFWDTDVDKIYMKKIINKPEFNKKYMEKMDLKQFKEKKHQAILLGITITDYLKQAYEAKQKTSTVDSNKATEFKLNIEDYNKVKDIAEESGITIIDFVKELNETPQITVADDYHKIAEKMLDITYDEYNKLNESRKNHNLSILGYMRWKIVDDLRKYRKSNPHIQKRRVKTPSRLHSSSMNPGAIVTFV